MLRLTRGRTLFDLRFGHRTPTSSSSNPVALHAKVGDKIPFSVLSAHVFMSGEELLPAKSVNVSLLEGNPRILRSMSYEA